MIPNGLWTYRARLSGVVDGDTIDVTIDAGFRNYRTERLRLLDVNAPEMHGPSHTAGQEAKAYVTFWMVSAMMNDAGGWPLILQTQKSDVFGRFLARVWRRNDGACLNEDLISTGHAVVDIRP